MRDELAAIKEDQRICYRIHPIIIKAQCELVAFEKTLIEYFISQYSLKTLPATLDQAKSYVLSIEDVMDGKIYIISSLITFAKPSRYTNENV